MREYGDLRDGAVGAIGRLTEAGKDIIVMVADSTSTAKIGAFMKAYPDRVVNVGIAEQNMVGMAAGLALGGHTVFTANAAPFLVGRANEQVKNDICYSATNVKMLGLNAGVAYGAPIGDASFAPATDGFTRAIDDPRWERLLRQKPTNRETQRAG